MTNEQRLELTRSLRLDAGQAEVGSEFGGQSFHVVPEHVRALDPSVVLIIGDRGAGKTKLREAATNPQLREALLKQAPGVRLGSGLATWKTGHPLDAAGPDAHGWEHFASQHEHDGTALHDLWFAYLVRVLKDDLDSEAQGALADMLDAPGGDPNRCFSEFNKVRGPALLALDRLDRKLQEEGRWVFVAYDELDTLFFFNWKAMGTVVRGLVSFWAGYARRWKCVRAKLFLRTDFYRHHGDVVGADIAKLAANRVELSWSDKHLHAALIKHIANRSTELLRYCKLAGIEFAQLPTLGAVPKITKAEDARPFVERLIDKYMGAGDKKGQAFNWILDHIRDGNSKASPRSLVLLIEKAAELEAGSPRASGVHLLSPISLRNALDKVSTWHVGQAKKSEFPWLAGLEERLQTDREVPWERTELERLLRNRWDENWSKDSLRVRPPADTPHELVDALVELGVVRARGKEKFDVPDLFLHGLNLRRKGGVRRR
jgi:hypothetical protein